MQPTVLIATRLTEARMFANAKNTVLQSKGCMTAREIAEIATYSGNYSCASPEMAYSFKWQRIIRVLLLLRGEFELMFRGKGKLRFRGKYPAIGRFVIACSLQR